MSILKLHVFTCYWWNIFLMYTQEYLCDTLTTCERGSQHITSPETMMYVQEAGQRSQKIEKSKESKQKKQAVCKRAILQKAKRDRLVRKYRVNCKINMLKED